MIGALLRPLLTESARLLTGLTVHGAVPEGTGRHLFFADHVSHLDTLMILAALPPALRRQTHPVAARDYWGKTGLRRLVARDGLRSVLIDRQPAPDQDALAPVHDVLAQGHSIVLYPAGTRGEPGAPFKSGIYRIAERWPDCRLVPVHIDNLSRVMPKGASVPLPLLCSLRFGPVLPRIPGESKADFLARAQAALAALAAARPAATAAEATAP